jgi:AraC-like DNA-binding protein
MDAKYTKKDMQLLAAVTAYVELYISKQVITLAMAGDSLQMSHEAIHYKIRSLTGLSGSEFILKLRLRHCLHLMVDEHRNITEAADRSGFKNIPYFQTCFQQEYGMTPMEYLNNVTTKTIAQ